MKYAFPATSTLTSPSASKQEKDIPSLEVQSGNVIQVAKLAEVHQLQFAQNAFQVTLYPVAHVSPAMTPTLSPVPLKMQVTLSLAKKDIPQDTTQISQQELAMLVLNTVKNA